tara:strand:+ start:3586 stop:4128 length:543 start_codon:yes stop_codon:yes gene_type:complete
MKKLILLGLITVTFAACNTTPKVEATPEVEVAPKAIGYEMGDDGVKVPLYSGDLSTVAIWEAYITAHNERDLETIRSLNAEKDFKAYGPTGVVFEGSDAHIEFLTTWFEATNPKWKSSYFIENEFTNKKGELRQWVTSGHGVTLTVDGEEVKLAQVHDALIVDGKIQMFYVTERILAEGE